MKEVPVLFTRKAECMGCTACYSVCPMKAIEMLPDEEGYLYPIIDEEKCVGCRACINVCPMKGAVD